MEQKNDLISRWISALYRYKKGYANKRLEPYGLGGGRFVFLFSLRRHNGVSQEELSDYLKIDKTTTAKALKKLEGDGYVTRNRETRDKRVFHVNLTQKATETLPIVEQIIEKWESLVTSGITGAELALLEKTLRKMANKAQEVSKEDQTEKKSTEG
ncbi:Transcriptional regulator SlyA [bioreactor metagenome]|uniref:Transcriptional regulator SlyA n=1 Tax=bioreactor metagenome TaxID=1076179 RepID=A0A644Y6Q2_9ZZZZ